MCIGHPLVVHVVLMWGISVLPGNIVVRSVNMEHQHEQKCCLILHVIFPISLITLKVAKSFQTKLLEILAYLIKWRSYKYIDKMISVTVCHLHANHEENQHLLVQIVQPVMVVHFLFLEILNWVIEKNIDATLPWLQ